MNIPGRPDHINGIQGLDRVPSWTYRRNAGFRLGKAPKRRYVVGRKGVLGIHLISAQKYLAHMSSVEDYPNIRFRDRASASHILHHNSSNVNTLVMTFSLKFASCKGMLWPKGIQNMQFAPT